MYDKAENQWKKHQDNPNYTETEHREWVANIKDGISNFGLHLSLLPRSSIQPDVFHLGCLIEKRLIAHLHLLAVRQSALF